MVKGTITALISQLFVVSRHDNQDIISIFYLEYPLQGVISHAPTILCSISIIVVTIIIITVVILTIFYLISPIHGSA